MSMSMWASPSGTGNSHNNSITNLACSPSNSNSKSSSSACSSPIPTSKSMEQVWKDITLASDLHHHSPSVTPATLQDFLGTPFQKHQLPKSNKDALSSSSAADSTFLPCLTPQPAGHQASTSGSRVVDLGFLKGTTATIISATAVPVRAAGQQSQTFVNAMPSALAASYNPAAFDTSVSSLVFPSTDIKKRPQDNGDNSSDRRHKRMIKNRESAARSRARKQESCLSASLS